MVGIHVSEPGRPQGTRLPEAFRARRVTDLEEPHELQKPSASTEQPVDPARFELDQNPRLRRALAEYQDEPKDEPDAQSPYLAVAKLASSTVLSTSAEQTLENALNTMDKHYIHHLVVMTPDNQVAGLIGKQWVLWNLWKNEGASLQLADMELPAFITVTPETDAHHLAQQMLSYQLSAALVIDRHNRPAGIITDSDFLRLYADGHPLHTTA